jgi:hypothetical protein
MHAQTSMGLISAGEQRSRAAINATSATATEGDTKEAKAVPERRAALAGYRLAMLLEALEGEI